MSSTNPTLKNRLSSTKSLAGNAGDMSPDCGDITMSPRHFDIPLENIFSKKGQFQVISQKDDVIVLSTQP